MAHRYQRVLHVFRRDLRLHDNTALHHASADAAEVLCCFILDPRQIGPQPYRGDASLQFLLESLRELEAEVSKAGGSLAILHGQAEEVIPALVAAERLEAVYFNRDYTPFARNRDRAIRDACVVAGCAVHQFGDALVQEPEAVQKPTGGAYTVYTPFMKRASQLPVRRPHALSAKNVGRLASAPGGLSPLEGALSVRNEHPFARGGRAAALKTLGRAQDFSEYATERDFPSRQATTGLSAHHKFGTISVRESYWAIADAHGASHTIIRELYWRDFFTHIAFHFPHVFGAAFNPKYADIPWENNDEWFGAWCEGRTGFPIVDAGMRQLNQSGFMHNRVRMIVASFLTKDLLIDWRWGERYFATRLVDYDPAVNNGGWQWAASTGCDAQPYFRIFNPWLQQERFDSEAEYITRWIPELSGVEPRVVHRLHETPLPGARYPKPIVEHAEQKTRALRLFGA